MGESAYPRNWVVQDERNTRSDSICDEHGITIGNYHLADAHPLLFHAQRFR